MSFINRLSSFAGTTAYAGVSAVKTTAKGAFNATKVGVTAAKWGVPHHPAVGLASTLIGSYTKAQATVHLPGLLTKYVVWNTARQFSNQMIGRAFAYAFVVPSMVPPLINPATIAVVAATTVGATVAGNLVNKAFTKAPVPEVLTDNDNEWEKVDKNDNGFVEPDPVSYNWTKLNTDAEHELIMKTLD